MKVKHCFFFILFVLVVGSFFLALSISPLVRSSLKSFNKDTSVPSSKSAGRTAERGTVTDAASSNRAPPSAPVVGPSQAPAPVLSPQPKSLPNESDAALEAELAQCKSELKLVQSALPAKDDSKVDLRAQLQEAQVKLKAAEEEIARLQAQQPQQGDGDASSHCRIIEREANLCKGELRVVHSKYSALQSVVSSFLEQGSASASAESSAEKVLSKEKEAAMSRLVDSEARDEHSDSAAPDATEAPTKSKRAASAAKQSKSGKSSSFVKASKQPLPEVAATELDEHADHADQVHASPS